MRTHSLLQGSPEWLAYRSTHFNASDTPAMLGVSPYKTRTELLHELHTGLSAEIDAATQRRFDLGHAAEAAARPLAESEIGEDLYPVVGSLEIDGLPLSASFDGLTMAEDIVWEHKLMNVNLAESLADGIIPDIYHPQLEQQLMVSGAKKALFMATSADKTAMECVWYTSRPELRAAILQGWTQFAIDLENYVPQAAEVKAVAAPQFGLPAVSIQVNGSIALIDNLQAFGTALTAYVEKINLKPETDQDFADLETTVKTLKNAEDALDAAESGALAQTESIDAMRRTVAMYRDTARTSRLMVDKLVKIEKEQRKMVIVRDAVNALDEHTKALNARIGDTIMPQITGDFAGAVKGLKSIDSMRDKVNTELARCKIEANAIADKITANLKAINDQPAFEFLFFDKRSLALKEPEFVEMAVKNRISDHQAKEVARIAAETARIAEQERLKAQATERARADAEIAAATAKAQSEAKAQADADAKRAIDEVIAKARELDYMAKIDTSRMMHNASGQPDKVPVLIDVAPVFIDKAESKDSPLSPPTLRLGQICERLGFNLTADFMRQLGFEPAATEKAAKLYHENDFPRMCAALVRHIQSVLQGGAL